MESSSRPLAVEAGFGKWGNSGIIENEKYGTNFMITDFIILFGSISFIFEIKNSFIYLLY